MIKLFTSGILEDFLISCKTFTENSCFCIIYRKVKPIHVIKFTKQKTGEAFHSFKVVLRN